MIVQACTLFYSAFRLQMIVDLTGTLGGVSGPTEAVLRIGASAPQQTASCHLMRDEVWEIVVEALVDRDRFPSEAMIEITRAGLAARIPVIDIIKAGLKESQPQTDDTFGGAIDAWAKTHAPQRATAKLMIGEPTVAAP